VGGTRPTGRSARGLSTPPTRHRSPPGSNSTGCPGRCAAGPMPGSPRSGPRRSAPARRAAGACTCRMRDRRSRSAVSPPTVFVKSTFTFVTRLEVGSTGGAAGEARFYRDIARTVDVTAPVGYHGVADRRTGGSVLLIEDLPHTRGVWFGDVHEPLDEVAAGRTVDTLAALHGRCWTVPGSRATCGPFRPVPDCSASSTRTCPALWCTPTCTQATGSRPPTALVGCTTGRLRPRLGSS
jgi:hypothetical protein